MGDCNFTYKANGQRVLRKSATVSEDILRQAEDKSQREDAKFEGRRLGAGSYEYTAQNGQVYKGETGNNRGGTYRTQFSEDVYQYSKMNTSELQAERKRLQIVSDTNYEKATRAAASRTGTFFNTMATADVQIRAIDQILRRRKRKEG